jgi:hypothetical protein
MIYKNDGYVINITSKETYDWSVKNNKQNCFISGRTIEVIVDEYGFVDIMFSDNSNDEFNTNDMVEVIHIIKDFLPLEYHKYWPIFKEQHD